MKEEKNHPSPLQSWLIWSSGGLFFLLGFFHRVAPAVLHRELTVDFSLSASSLGALTSLYYYSYTAMQIPTGLLADLWGPRRLLAFGLISTAISSAFFAISEELFWAGVARFLIGGSVAVAFVTTLKLSSHWLPPKRYAFATGMLLVAGMTGAVFAGYPLHQATILFGWRNVTLASALLALLMAVLVFMFVRDDPSEKGLKSYLDKESSGQKEDKILRSLGRVFRFSNTATLCSLVMLAWALSGPIYSLVSERIQLRRMPYLIGTMISLISWSLVFLIPGWSLGVLSLLLFLAGFFSGGMILGFAQGKETFPLSLSGTVSGVINMGVLTGPMLLQPLVGFLLDSTKPTAHTSMEISVGFSFEDYRFAFLPVLIWLVLSVLALYLSQESYCKNKIFNETKSE